MDIFSTFHAQVKYISVENYAIETIGPVGAKNAKIYLYILRHEDPI